LYLRAPDGRLFLPPPQTTTRPGPSGVMPAPQSSGSRIPEGSGSTKAAGTGVGNPSPSQPPPAVTPPTSVSAPPSPGRASRYQAGQHAQSAYGLPGPSPVGVPPGAPTPGVPPRKGWAGLIAVVSLLLVIVVAGSIGALYLLRGGSLTLTPG